ncbi:MAG: GGDEF domain-containing protein [Thermoleophilaceae bacterium]
MRTARSESGGPFRKEGLLRRSAPFLAAMVLSYAAIRLPAQTRNGGEILVAAGLNALLVLAILVLPWHRFPRFADVLPPLAYMVVVALLRDALGGAPSAYSTLLILPVLWIALHGTRGQLAVAVLGVAVLLATPVLLIGGTDYPDEEWRRVLLWTTVSGIVALAAQDLVEQVRQRAEALHTVSAAVGRRTREIETRSAICEAAKENARAQYAILLEPDANGRRLVTTAATDPQVEGTELYLSNDSLPAVRSYQHGREQLQNEGGESLLMTGAGMMTPVETILWHPVPGRESPMGVIGVAWTDPVKRLPETLPTVMEALAAEAAGVIERTTLLLKLENVVKVDEVTGLPNDRAWEEEVPRELSRARRQGTPLSVVILDLGDFESGPDGDLGAGDRRLLREAANTWRRDISPSDFLAHRTPGRFSVLFPNIGAEQAEAAALRLQSRAPQGRHCAIAVAAWNGLELPAQLVDRAETQIELERAASSPD